MSSVWRVGRKVGRTLYRDDVLVGLMDSAVDAAEVVAAMGASPDPRLSLLLEAAHRHVTKGHVATCASMQFRAGCDVYVRCDCGFDEARAVLKLGGGQ